MLRQIDSPMPMSVDFVVNKGLKNAIPDGLIDPGSRTLDAHQHIAMRETRVPKLSLSLLLCAGFRTPGFMSERALMRPASEKRQ